MPKELSFWDKLQAKVGFWLDGTTLEAEQQRSEYLDRLRQAENEKDADKYGEEWLEQTRRNDALQLDEEDFDDYVEEGFEEGYAEGQQNVVDFGAGIGTVAGDVAGTGLKAGGAAIGETLKGAGKGLLGGLGKLPWWVWPVIVLVVGGWIYFQIKSGKRSFAFGKKLLKP